MSIRADCRNILTGELELLKELMFVHISMSAFDPDTQTATETQTVHRALGIHRPYSITEAQQSAGLILLNDQRILVDLSYIEAAGIDPQHPTIHRIGLLPGTVDWSPWEGMVLQYNFEETEGVVIYDSTSGREADIVATDVNDITYGETSLARLNSYIYGGVSDYFSLVGGIAGLDGNLTINLWFQFGTVPADGIAKLFEAAGQATILYDAAESEIQWIHDDHIDLIVSAAPNTEWHMLTFRRSGSNLRFYLDGVHVAHTHHTPHIPNLSNVDLNFGCWYEEEAEAIDGGIDQFSIWNRALTDAEIIAIYNGGLGLTYTGPQFSVVRSEFLKYAGAVAFQVRK